jgi:tetratricopeptide (TPR) repeat protein
MSSELAQRPEVEVEEYVLARLMIVEGRVRNVLGDYRQARDVFERALNLAEASLAADPNSGQARYRLHEVQVELSMVLRLLGAYDRGLELAEEALAFRREQLEIDRTNQRAWTQLLRALMETGQLAESMGEIERARRLREEALAVADGQEAQWPQEESFVTAAATARTMQAQTLVALEDWRGVERLCRDALERYDSVSLAGDGSINRCATIGILARALRNLGRTEEAIETTLAYRDCAVELTETRPQDAWPKYNAMVSLDSLGSLYGGMAADEEAALEDRVRWLEHSIRHYTENRDRAEQLIEAGLLAPQARANVAAVEATIEENRARLDALRAELED